MAHSFDTPLLKSVRIRMYRHGLGDCFLLTFTNNTDEQHHMLVDCGVLGFTGGERRVDLAAIDIKQETNHHVHTLVATHEHADHISGFLSAAEHFGLKKKKKDNKGDPLQVDRVWLAWTENPQDPQTRKIIAKNSALAMGISASQMGMDAEQAQAIQDLMLFGGSYLGLEDDQDHFADAEQLSLAGEQDRAFQISKNAIKIMNTLRDWAPVDYLEPDDIREIDDFGVKVYILGPSRKMRMLGGNAPESPSSGEGHKLSMLNSFMAAAIQNAGLKLADDPQAGWSQKDIQDMAELSSPFDSKRGIPLAEAKKRFEAGPFADPEKQEAAERQAAYHKFFQQVYGFADPDQKSPPAGQPLWFGADWRRIDQDWLQVGANMALQYVSTINNTSLVMAIELVESGKVLLFVGDAEGENWSTWHNEHADLDKLLADTVVYKVGHHGSHNATDLQKLAKMTHKELVALVPVDMAAARNTKKWNFPADNLVLMAAKKKSGDEVVEWKLPQADPQNPEQAGALFMRANQRVIINCAGKCADEGPLYDPDLFQSGEITQDSSDAKLWVDYTLELQTHRKKKPTGRRRALPC